MPIPVKPHLLNRLVAAMRNINVFPYQLEGYDFDPSSNPVSEPLRLCVDDSAEAAAAATDEELEAAIDSTYGLYQMRIPRDGVLKRDPVAIRVLAFYVVVEATRTHYWDFRKYTAPGYFQDSRIYREYPELCDHHDEEGLLDLAAPGLRLARIGIFYKDHVLHYHQFLRRYFTSNMNFDFTHRLASFRARYPDRRVKIAIDHTRLMPEALYQEIMEFDRWYGPPLNWGAIDDPNAIGLTVHIPSQRYTAAMRHTYPIERTEFLWNWDGSHKALQVEEVRPFDAPLDPITRLWANRYLHSLRDVNKRVFTHLDGAVTLYEEQTYRRRHDSHLPDSPRSEHKVKLFRVDGEIPDEEWSNLVSFFFRQNEMVLEYLEQQG